ncbi:MAG: phosphoribosylanthranilate isomerase [Gemmatimonadota bacterium]|nr:phosphoribosylanthranilate isomerase [Gemmatimonadota bacterium]
MWRTAASCRRSLILLKLRSATEPGNRNEPDDWPESSTRCKLSAMDVIHPVRVKVACIRNAEEARCAVSFGVAAVGMAAEVPGGGPNLTASEIAEIAASVPESIGTFLLTVRRTASELAELARATRVNTIQLWDQPDPGAYARLRSAVPGISIVQSIPIVAGEGTIERALDVASRVDALVLDSAQRTPPYRWEEQHGRTHDWQVSRRIVEAVGIPVILSGGLSHRNVADAIRAVRPYGVEVCTGVRRNGSLDTRLLVQFLEVIGRVNP